MHVQHQCRGVTCTDGGSMSPVQGCYLHGCTQSPSLWHVLSVSTFNCPVTQVVFSMTFSFSRYFTIFRIFLYPCHYNHLSLIHPVRKQSCTTEARFAEMVCPQSRKTPSSRQNTRKEGLPWWVSWFPHRTATSAPSARGVKSCRTTAETKVSPSTHPAPVPLAH